MRRHHFFLTLIYTLLILSIGIVYSQNDQVQQAFNSTITEIAYQSKRGLAQLSGQPAPKKPQTEASQSSSSNNSTSSSAEISTTQNGGGRWPNKNATVYINMPNPTLRQATNEAITAWNKTGAFHFKVTNKRKGANVIVNESNKQDGAAGLTKSTLNASNGYFIKVWVYLNGNYLLNPTYGYNHQRIVNTAEHELGHAMGLEHTNSTSVMQPAGSMYSIQPGDVQAVKFIYSHNPSRSADAYGQQSSSSSSPFDDSNNNN